MKLDTKYFKWKSSEMFCTFHVVHMNNDIQISSFNFL